MNQARRDLLAAFIEVCVGWLAFVRVKFKRKPDPCRTGGSPIR